MAKIRNISGQDLIVPSLGGRLVLAGQVVELEADQVYGFTVQGPNWEPVDKQAKAVHDEADAVAAPPAPETPPASATSPQDVVPSATNNTPES